MTLQVYHPEHRRPRPDDFIIWLDDREYLFVVLDEVDYLWAQQWRWNPRPDRHGNKFYAVRNLTRRSPGIRNNTTLYLHVEIMKRVRPFPGNGYVADHRNGCEFNCTRKNLRWATHSMNRRNIRGSMPYDLEELSAQGSIAQA